MFASFIALKLERHEIIDCEEIARGPKFIWLVNVRLLSLFFFFENNNNKHLNGQKTYQLVGFCVS